MTTIWRGSPSSWALSFAWGGHETRCFPRLGGRKRGLVRIGEPTQKKANAADPEPDEFAGLGKRKVRPPVQGAASLQRRNGVVGAGSASGVETPAWDASASAPDKLSNEQIKFGVGVGFSPPPESTALSPAGGHSGYLPPSCLGVAGGTDASASGVGTSGLGASASAARDKIVNG